jgi:hypothetical protein
VGGIHRRMLQPLPHGVVVVALRLQTTSTGQG